MAERQRSCCAIYPFEWGNCVFVLLRRLMSVCHLNEQSNFHTAFLYRLRYLRGEVLDFLNPR